MGTQDKKRAEFPSLHPGLSSSVTNRHRFANAENLARFKENPERYVPAYGGYCAWAVSQGYLAKGDPAHWSIRQGRLYLNYNQSVQDTWLQSPDRFIQQADANWPGVLN
jgi:hypothetical protein